MRRVNGEMLFRKFTVGSLATNCYVVWASESKVGVIIDPGFETEAEESKILDFIRRSDLRIAYILNTHGHFDHIAGDAAVKEDTGASIMIHKLDARYLNEPALSTPFYNVNFASVKADVLLEEGDEIRIGGEMLKVIHTPGHTMGSISILGREGVFTGDTLFAGSIGRVDLPGSSSEAMRNTLKEKIIKLRDGLYVYPGHGPFTTMKVEKENNPYLRGEW